MSSVAAILAEMAANAGRARYQRGVIIGNTIADLSQIPGQISADRERQLMIKDQRRRQQAQSAAEQRQAAVAHQIITAYTVGTPNDPTTNNLAAGEAKAIELDAAEWIPKLREMDRAERAAAQPKITHEDPANDIYVNGVLTKPGVRPLKTTTNDLALLSQNSNPIVANLASGALDRARPPRALQSENEWQVDGKSTPVIFDATTGARYLTPADVAAKKAIDPSRMRKIPAAAAGGGMNALYGDIDPQAIAAQIRLAKHPPDISQYGRPAAAAIASQLAKKGPNGEPPFDLSAAQREWKAQIRLNATMNGSQQVRLDESIRSGLAMYDQVDALAEKWDGMGIGLLSRANLAAARNGLKGKEAASLANQLTGQIGQLTSDIATIEQGGLTPTNESRAVAEKSMQDWWGKGTIKDMTAQGRYNMQIRHTARNTQETMVPGNAVDTRLAVPATPVPTLAASSTQRVVQNGVTYDIVTDASGKVISSKIVKP